mgnify:CR=1 FL=1
MKHFETIKESKNANQYICRKCDFICFKTSNYNKHILTAKHKNNLNETNEPSKNAETTQRIFICHICNIYLKSRTTLWRHKKTCVPHEKSNTELSSTSPISISSEEKIENDRYELLTKTILDLMKKNDALTNSIVEMSKQIGNNNNNTINSNNKFNLNVFLNEKCKNAMSLTDFVKSMNLTVQDFIETGERGFIDGISNIIIERINNMELHDRPLHCTDLKRETVYVKDAEKWEKDEDKNKLRKAVKWVANKNERIRPVWYEETPDVEVMGTDNYEKFFKYSESALGGCGREETKLFEDKVMKNVMKEVTIDKEKAIVE